MGDEHNNIVPLWPDKEASEVSSVVGRAIREMRRERKMTQQELGDLLGLSGMRIQKMETAHESVSAVYLEKLAKVFGVEIIDFFKAELTTGTSQGSDDDLAKLQSECMHLIRGVNDANALLLMKNALLKLTR